MATEELQTIARASPAVSQRPGPRRLTVFEPRRSGFVETLKELWRYRSYTLYFAQAGLRRRYLRTWLGPLWLPLRPMLNIGAKLLVFGGLVGISSGNVPYPIFFITATAGWQIFQESVIWSTRSIDLNRTVLRRVHVPRLVAIIGAAASSSVEFLISLSLVAAGLVYYYLRAHVFYLELRPMTPVFVIPALLLLFMLGAGVGLVTATLTARARDLRFGVAYLLGFVYYLTPVIYPFSSIPNQYKPVAELNPVTGAIELFKAGLFPGETVSPKAVAVTVAVALVMWGPGLWLFQRRDALEA